jgi:Dihydroprymidine dehydrogenase domain II, 4Fe-4S cluster
MISRWKAGVQRLRFSTVSRDELVRLNDELRRQGETLRRQEDLLTQVLLRLSPQTVSISTGTQKHIETKPPPSSKAPRGFIDFQRSAEAYRPAEERARDWKEIAIPGGHKDPLELKRQAARCMDCGTPFCQTNTGCPINNLIPEWNELVLTDRWKGKASELLIAARADCEQMRLTDCT